MTTIKQLKNGNYFILASSKEATENNTWIRGEYDREEKKYLCYKFNDVNHYKYFKGATVVNQDIIF